LLVVARRCIAHYNVQRAQNCKTKAEYGKGEHAFKLLASIDPAKVMAASPWARRFVDELKKKMGA
jgi:hypothetical protein